MIFISKKAFEKIRKMEEEIRNLKFRVEYLEERDRTPVPKPNTEVEE